MKKDEFVQLVQQSEFLEAGRQKTLLENAAWMTDEERGLLAKNIEATGKQMEENAKPVLEGLEKLETAVKAFGREELPKMRKEVEEEEHKEAETKAEKLLGDL